MKKLIALIAVVTLLAIALLAPTGSIAQEGYIPAEIQTVQLTYHDPLVYGGLVGEYIDDRGVVDEWVAPNDVAIIGSRVYFEVYPIWRPAWNEGVIDGDIELSHNAGLANGTLNKADLCIVLGVELGGMFAWGNFVEESTLMFPAGTAVILEEGEKLSLVADGRNNLMGAANAVAMYFRAYVFYVNLN